MFKRHSVLMQSLLAVASLMIPCESARAAILYVPYTASVGPPFAPSFGIAEFDAKTLQLIGGFNTTAMPVGLSYDNGSLYDIENGNMYQRNAATGAQIDFESPIFTSQEFVSTGLVGGDLYVAGNEVVGSSAAPFYALDNSLEYRLVDQNTRQSPTGLFNYATGANGNLYASLGGQIIISTPPPDHGILHSTFGETDSVHIGQLLYNPDAKLIQAAATVSVSGIGNFQGIFDYDPNTGKLQQKEVIVGLVPEGIPLTYEPSGLAYGFSSLYATNQEAIYRYDSNGNVLGSATFTPLGASTVLGQLLLVQLPGDFNQDNHVDAADIAAMENALVDLHSYQTTNSLSDSQMLTLGDLNGDGVVNNADLQALLNLLKSGGGSNNPVPEPSALALLALGSVVLVARRRSSIVCMR